MKATRVGRRPGQTEAGFQAAVIQMATLFRWRVWHQRPGLTRSDKWASAGTGHPGCPDLILARRGVVLLVELKSAAGRLGPGQAEWGEAIGSAHYRLWRPADWPEIERTLSWGPS